MGIAAWGRCETPLPSDAVAASAGVNVHLHYADTVYGDFALIQKLLLDLGVRHIRDGLTDTSWRPYYERHAALGRQGIRCIFITSPNQSDELLTSFPARVGEEFEGYEAPNEYDLSRDPNWAATLSLFLPRLHRAVQSDPRTAAYPIYGPSITRTESFEPLAGLQQYFDFGNLHNYFGGRNPGTAGWGAGGYGSIAYAASNARTAWPGRPLVTTETGYYTDLSDPGGIPESVEGIYIPRVVLEQKLHGIDRTYFYELIDEAPEIGGVQGSFGLAHRDGSPKPAFSALKNLIALLSDPGPAATLRPLSIQLTGGSPSVHHLLMEKRDGTYLLAFWLEREGYDVNRRAVTPVSPERISPHLDRAFSKASLAAFAPDGSITIQSLTLTPTLELAARDTVSILELR